MNSSERVSVRINLTAKEIEVSGQSKDVEVWVRRLRPYLRKMASSGSRSSTESNTKEQNNIASAESSSVIASDAPAVFGEFLVQFPNSITDVDRALIAAYFVQTNDPDKAFVTRQVAAALKDQGVKLINPSESIRRNLIAKRVFKLGEGRFRVSQSGAEYVRQLRAAQTS